MRDAETTFETIVAGLLGVVLTLGVVVVLALA
jgi:hypothetical protein